MGDNGLGEMKSHIEVQKIIMANLAKPLIFTEKCYRKQTANS